MEDQQDQQPSQSITKVIADVLQRGGIAVVVTLVRAAHKVGSKILIDETGNTVGGLGDFELDSLVTKQAAAFLASREETRMFSVSDFVPTFPAARETFLLFERLQPTPRLVICGAGHVGASLAKLGTFVGYQTTLIDDRPEFLSRDRFPDAQIELVVTDDWGSAVREAIGNGAGVSVAVVTRGHNEDEQCMHAVIRTSPDYVGLIGSKRRTSIVIERLREAGATEEQLKKIRAPIGLDIGAVTPEEVALAIISEIVAERRGAKGGSMSAWRRA
jgi:xanthine dehydrogenase accessory factor